MTIAMSRTAIVMLASGLSRRYGRKDKMLAELGGRPLIEHAAGVVAGVNALVRVAVCPADRKEIGERLIDRFVIAVNKKPKMGLGHSIAVGVQVALQFKPDAVLLVMGDMPFVEEWLLRDLVSGLGVGGAEVVHAGASDGVRPPTAFGAVCFGALAKLDGDDGARQVVKSGAFKVTAIAAPLPLLVDVDTKNDIEIAREQLRIREQHRELASARATHERPTVAPISLSQYRAGLSEQVVRRTS